MVIDLIWDPLFLLGQNILKNYMIYVEKIFLNLNTKNFRIHLIIFILMDYTFIYPLIKKHY